MNPFHLAIAVHDIELARAFYINILGCRQGRSDTRWVDFDFFGHQLVCHLDESMHAEPRAHNPVDGHDVPIPHFGIVLNMEDWQHIANKLKASNINFVIEPYIRFKGQPGEQGTLFFYDPSGNAIEIKGFNDIHAQLFAT
jgi:uncharacterized protein